MTTDIMIASAAQTPVGSFNGAFATSPPTTLVPSRLRLLSIALEVAAEEVDEVILGQSRIWTLGRVLPIGTVRE